SPYGPIVNQLARALALAFGDNLTRQLRAYQAINALVLVLAAALTGRAFGARAAAALLFSPIAIIDGTVNPHNDAILALSSAAFALALARPSRAREGAGLIALAAGLAVKVSAALL